MASKCGQGHSPLVHPRNRPLYPQDVQQHWTSEDLHKGKDFLFPQVKVEKLGLCIPASEKAMAPQYSCLENPMDGGAWWAAVHGISKSRTRLSDFTFTFHFHFSLSCIGEGNGNPLQCSYLENPRDSGAWWAAIYGVTHSRTRLKQLSSSSSMFIMFCV